MPFKPGQIANPHGRPRRSRDRLTEAFLIKMEADWRKHGPDAIAAAREKDPAAYLRVIASLVPKDITLNVENPLAELDDAEVGALVEAARAALRARTGTEPAGDTPEPESVH